MCQNTGTPKQGFLLLPFKPTPKRVPVKREKNRHPVAKTGVCRDWFQVGFQKLVSDWFQVGFRTKSLSC